MTGILRCSAWLLAAGIMGAVGPAIADSGDVLRVTAERANLRAGPSDETTALTQVLLGDELVELRRDRSWVGVRVMRTGEEGWIYGDLVALEAQSRLEGGMVEASVEALPQDFDRLIGRLDQAFGYSLVAALRPEDDSALTVTPTDEFLLYGSREAHVATALALHQMWKRHRDGQPVSVMLLGGDGQPYVTIRDQADGTDMVPEIDVEAP